MIRPAPSEELSRKKLKILTHFTDLPYDTLCVIASYCDMNTATAFGKTCSDTWNAAHDKASNTTHIKIESILDRIEMLSSKLTLAENNMMLAKIGRTVVDMHENIETDRIKMSDDRYKLAEHLLFRNIRSDVHSSQFSLYRMNTMDRLVKFTYQHSPYHVEIQIQFNGSTCYQRLLTIGSSKGGYNAFAHPPGIYSVYGTRRKYDDRLSMVKQLDRIREYLDIEMWTRGELLAFILNICSKGMNYNHS